MGAKLFQRARTAASRPKAWYERSGGERFRHDDAIVRDYYPRLSWTFDEATKLARLDGSITIVEAGGITTPIDTRIDFPRDYPASEPDAFEVAKRFAWSRDRHIETDGYCCLWLPPFSRWRPEDPDALRDFLDELAVFFHRQLVFDVTQRWPGPAWDHGVFGYWQFVVEHLGGDRQASAFIAGVSLGRNDPCPCGSDRHYKRCHLQVHEDLARRIGPIELKRLRDYPDRSKSPTSTLPTHDPALDRHQVASGN